jgi:cation:H+ antiporter
VIKEQTVLSEIPYSLIAILLLGFVANASIFNPQNALLISRWDGVVMMAFFCLFMIYVFQLIKRGKADLIDATPEDMLPMGKSILFTILGITGLFFGGQWVVTGAILIAQEFGMSQKLIGLTVVAIGTSLPELVTSAIAAYKKNTDIAVANVVGSNIFNIFWVLGLSAIISPIEFDPAINIDIIVLIAATCLIIINLVVSRKSSLTRIEGVLFVLSYIGYTIFLVNRG